MASARFATFSTQEIEKIVENKDSIREHQKNPGKRFSKTIQKLVRAKRTAVISEMLDQFLRRKRERKTARPIQWGRRKT